MIRVKDHPILGPDNDAPMIEIIVDGAPMKVREGSMIAAALMENGYTYFRTTQRTGERRFYYCGIGQCTDCMMEVDGIPGVRTCITPVKPAMRVNRMEGLGTWRKNNEND